MPEKSVVRTEKAPAPFQGAPYSQAIRNGDLVFVSGQLALVPDHTEIVGETIQEQTEQVFKNLAAILEEAGSGVDKLVKTTVFLVDLGDFQGMNEVCARRWRSRRSRQGHSSRSRPSPTSSRPPPPFSRPGWLSLREHTRRPLRSVRP
jgi:2-iminobutanoate/2-iminopropanoate deaminase